MFYTKAGEKDFPVQHFIRELVKILYFKTKKPGKERKFLEEIFLLSFGGKVCFVSCLISGDCSVVGSAKGLPILKNSVFLSNYTYLYLVCFTMRQEMESNPVQSLATVVPCSEVY